MNPLVSLAAASIAFVGSHFAMSHPLRAPLVGALGEKGFALVYSLVSAACMVWMYFAFTAIGAPTIPFWPGYDDVSWAIASLLTLAAMVLLVGSLRGNPALPAPDAERAAHKEPAGVFRVTRHPMMWGFALWAIAHMIATPTARTLIVATAILVLALVGAHLQDGKKERQLGAAWAGWEAKTSYWPRPVRLLTAGWGVWVIGTALWLLASWLHFVSGGMSAGVLRWV